MIRILLADDQKLLCEILQASLEQEADLQIVGQAHNGEEALEKIDRLRPDIALIDINMPVMDGLTATEKIRHDFPETKVIVLSGSEGESDRIYAFNVGAKSYIPKTAKAMEIVEQIRRVYYENLATESQPELKEQIIKFNQLKQELQNYCQTIQEKLERLTQAEAENKKYVEQLKTEQKSLSQEMLEQKTELESLVDNILRSAKESNSYGIEINKLQTLLEGQLSYIHNLNKRFNLLRKYVLIASGIAGLALVISLIGLVAS